MIIPEFVNVKIMKATQLKNIIRESIKEITNKKPLLEQGPPMSPENLNPGTFDYYSSMVQAGSGDITNDSGCYIELNGAHYLLKNGVIARPNGTPLTYNGGLATPAGDYGGCQPSHLAMEAIPTHVDQILNPEITPLTDFNQAGFPLVSDSVYGNPPSSVQPNSSFTTNQTFYNADEAVAFTTSPDFPNFDNQPQPIPGTNFLVVRYFEGYKSPEVEPTPEVEPIDPIGGVDPDAGFFNFGGSGLGDNPDAFQFPSGFNPQSWANEWVNNIFSFLSEPGGVPFGNVAQVVPNICQFLADRITLWTNQYSTAGPLYQNQLVFKLQAAYALQDYFDCSGAPFDNTSFPFNESLNEQIERSLPSNLKSIIAQLVQKVDRRVKQAEKEASKKDPKVDRMQKRAGIPKDKPMDKPMDKPEKK